MTIGNTIRRKSSNVLGRASCLSLAIFSALAATPAVALDDDPITKTLRTSFASPGARAAGMGGAFIGLADDSSAAFLNPAGIPLLPGMELTIEGRNRASDIPFAYGLNTGQVGSLDIDDESELTYLSFVLPFENWGIAAFYGAQPETSGKISVPGFGVTPPPAGPGGSPPPSDPNGFLSTVPYEGSLDLSDRYYGLGAGYAFENNVRVGASVYLAERELKSRGRYYDSFEYDDGELVYIYDYESATSTDWDDKDVGFNIGAHWSNASNTLSMGLSYRSELKFDSALAYQLKYVEFLSFEDEVLIDEDIRFSDIDDTTNIVPQAITFGIGWRPLPGWVVAMDIAYVEYSSRQDEIAPLNQIFGDEPGSQFNVADFMELSDAVEARLGVEHSFEMGELDWSVRGGTYWEGNSVPYFNATRFGDDNEPLSRLMQGIFPNIGGVWHGTIGVGLVAGGWVFDAAFDYSDRDQEVIMSMGYVWD